MPKRFDTDVVIVGGGLVGSLLANALTQIPMRVTLVEARAVAKLEQPSFDGRVTALANGSQRVLDQLGLWSQLREQAEPIETIHIGERGRFGAARIRAREEGVPALGYTVENRSLGEALWQPLTARPEFECIAPASVVEFEADERRVGVTIEGADGRETIEALLLIAADGQHSGVRRALGIASREDAYSQSAIILNCTTEQPHAGRAFERFTPDGPLAVLPLTDNRVGVVWTLPAIVAAENLALDDDEFRNALQRAFGFRLGRFLRIGRRTMHPLARSLSTELTSQRVVLIGNAAVSLHPVAGQGFNLAVRDVATLSELIADQRSAAGLDTETLLAAYRSWRRRDQASVAAFTHGLVRGFGLPGAGWLRGLALIGFDLLPGGKRLLARQTMGRAGRLPRLARGLDLV